jgi:methanogenic corrinoid protein MtbC1
MLQMKTNMTLFREVGVREEVKIMIGGAQFLGDSLMRLGQMLMAEMRVRLSKEQKS